MAEGGTDDGLLAGVPGSGPLTCAGVSILLAGVALAAGYAPALRATRLALAIALRHQ